MEKITHPFKTILQGGHNLFDVAIFESTIIVFHVLHNILAGHKHNRSTSVFRCHSIDNVGANVSHQLCFQLLSGGHKGRSFLFRSIMHISGTGIVSCLSLWLRIGRSCGGDTICIGVVSLPGTVCGHFSRGTGVTPILAFGLGTR